MKRIAKNRRYFFLTLALYLISIVLGNLLVAYLGPPGIIITSFVFIPFDFIIRCYIHELYSGKKLYFNLFVIVLLGGVLTYLLNADAKSVAVGSVCGFILATFVGSLVYQITIKKNEFLKVNFSDMMALISDSILFQAVAFGHINLGVLVAQMAIKLLGGLAWYYFLIKKGKLIERIKQPDFFVEIVKPWGYPVGTFCKDCYLYLRCGNDYYIAWCEFYPNSSYARSYFCYSGKKFVLTPSSDNMTLSLCDARFCPGNYRDFQRDTEREAKKLILQYQKDEFRNSLKINNSK